MGVSEDRTSVGGRGTDIVEAVTRKHLVTLRTLRLYAPMNGKR
jgi:hypothetical protein